MKIVFLVLLLLGSGGVASAAVINFSGQQFLATDVDNVGLNNHNSRSPMADVDNLPYGLLVADAHNNVPDRVIENHDQHPAGCCSATASTQGVPLPAAAWLFMSGLAVLLRMGHRRKK